jgi:adenylyltransferase/sulfurtransferase
MDTIQPADLKSRLDRGDALVLLDVRGPAEWAICSLPNARQIPLNELPARVAELEKDEDIVVYCKMGARSERAAAFLRDAGYRASSLRGGILAWSSEVDPSVPRY